jgi:hypothetical protein
MGERLDDRGEGPCGWWNRRPLLLALCLLAMVPLLLPAIPPLTDLPGHMGRFRVEQAIGSSPWLHRYFAFHWVLVGNLGVDLLVRPLAPWLGVEMATKIVVLAIPPATIAAMLFVARQIHGRIPPTALFALPLAYGFPFQFGFLNYVLAIAMMFAATGLWLRLHRWHRRGMLFVPIGLAIFIAHSMGWLLLGIAIWAIEAVGARRRGKGWTTAAIEATIAVSPLAPPLLILAWWSIVTVQGDPASFADWHNKPHYLWAVLRDESETFDVFGARLLWALLALGAGGLGMRIDPRLGLAGLLMLILFALMPGTIFDGHYADMRIIPYALAMLLLALRPDLDRRWLPFIAAAGLAFFVARIAAHTDYDRRLDRDYRAQLVALDHLPMGARVFALARSPCFDVWRQDRLDHLGSMAIVRRDAFVNGQWPMKGGRLLGVAYPPAEGFALDPSQILSPPRCRSPGDHQLSDIVPLLPRAAFDYVWLIGIPPAEGLHAPGFTPVWQGANGVLYRIAPTANP